MRKHIKIEKDKLVDLFHHIHFLSEMADEEPWNDETPECATDDPLPDVPLTGLFDNGERRRRAERDWESASG